MIEEGTPKLQKAKTQRERNYTEEDQEANNLPDENQKLLYE